MAEREDGEGECAGAQWSGVRGSIGRWGGRSRRQQMAQRCHRHHGAGVGIGNENGNTWGLLQKGADGMTMPGATRQSIHQLL